MTLVRMLSLDSSALQCDLAETYGIYDYKGLSPRKIALFSCGLGEDSRIMMKMNGQKVSMNTMLMAAIADRLSILIWQNTEDGHKGVNHPRMLVDVINGTGKKAGGDYQVFATGEEFSRKRRELLMKGGN